MKSALLILTVIVTLLVLVTQSLMNKVRTQDKQLEKLTKMLDENRQVDSILTAHIVSLYQAQTKQTQAIVKLTTK
jgi:uncharacterized membrane protein affecting hemolysin expression